MLLIHAEVDAVMLDIHIDFLEAAFVEQDVDAFAGGQAALGMLIVDAPLSTTHTGGVAFGFELFENGELGHADYRSCTE
jgi:hypothetical protein